MSATDKLTKLSLQLEAAKEQRAKIYKDAEQLNQLYMKAGAEVRNLEDAIRKERIRLLLNVEGAVCIGSVGEYPKLDHLSGTVVRVGRSYAIVRFENGENWKLLFEDVCRIEDKANRPRSFRFAMS
jgi:hypothetical protein